MNKKTYTDDMLIDAVKGSFSIREVLGKIGLSMAGGGNYRSIKREIQRLSLDTAHFLGQRHFKGKKHSQPRHKLVLDQILVKNTPYRGTNCNLKKRLIKAGKLRNECYGKKCSIKEPTWCDEPLVFHLDHINGDSDDYTLSNLRLLCPNCHSQTPTYCANKLRGTTRKRYYSDEQLAEAIKTSTNLTEVCTKIGLSSRSTSSVRRYISKLQLDTSHFVRHSPSNKGKRKYNDEQITEAVKVSKSIKEVCEKISASSPKTIKKRIKELGINTSHFDLPRGGVKDDILIEAVKNSTSMRETCGRLGLSPEKSHSYVWKRVRKLGLDTSHFTRRNSSVKAQSS